MTDNLDSPLYIHSLALLFREFLGGKEGKYVFIVCLVQALVLSSKENGTIWVTDDPQVEMWHANAYF